MSISSIKNMVINDLRLELAVRFVDIDGIVHFHCFHVLYFDPYEMIKTTIY